LRVPGREEGSDPRGPVERAADGGSLLAVWAQPGAKRDGVAGVWNGMLKVRVRAPAEGGRANEELAESLAEAFGLTRSGVRLVAGATTRRKRFHLALSPEAVRARLADLG
jgi:hypothetical protein